MNFFCKEVKSISSCDSHSPASFLTFQNVAPEQYVRLYNNLNCRLLFDSKSVTKDGPDAELSIAINELHWLLRQYLVRYVTNPCWGLPYASCVTGRCPKWYHPVVRFLFFLSCRCPQKQRYCSYSDYRIQARPGHWFIKMLRWKEIRTWSSPQALSQFSLSSLL